MLGKFTGFSAKRARNADALFQRMAETLEATVFEGCLCIFEACAVSLHLPRLQQLHILLLHRGSMADASGLADMHRLLRCGTTVILLGLFGHPWWRWGGLDTYCLHLVRGFDDRE